MFGKRRPQRLLEHYEPVLGTVMELQILGSDQSKIDERRWFVLDGIPKLERIFSVYDAESELSRFSKSNGELIKVGQQLAFVLQNSLEWWHESKGAFHPCAGCLAEAWRSGGDVAEVVTELKKSPYGWISHSFRKTNDLPINLNAAAKGYIVDQLAATAFRDETITEAMVNIGGDIRHFGDSGILVDVLDPRSNAANGEVISRVKVCNAGFATSGRSMRPIQLGNREISHVFDPRTGEPVEHWAGVSVLSTSARLADILATTLMVLSLDDGLELVADMDGTEFFAVDQSGEKFISPGWPCLMR